MKPILISNRSIPNISSLVLLLGWLNVSLVAANWEMEPAECQGSDQRQSAADGIGIEGTVLDDAGRPIRGARIAARVNYSMANFDEYLHHGLQYSDYDTNVVEGQSDADGAFRLPLQNDLWSTATLTVVAHRPGYAPAVEVWNEGKKLQFRLRKGSSIGGTVVSQDGQPVANAQITLQTWFTYQSNQQALGQRWKSVTPEGHLVGDHIQIQTKTDRNGDFELNDIPGDRWVVLAIAADRYLSKSIVADTGADPAVESGADAQLFFDGGQVRLDVAKPLELAAVSQEGFPVPLEKAYGSLLKRLTINEPELDRAKPVPFRNNRISLPALPPSPQRFWLIPTTDSGYLGTSVDVMLTEEMKLWEQQVTLSKGAKVIGRVVDDQTNEPIAGVPFHYDPVSPTEFKETQAFVPVTKSNDEGQFTMIVPAIDANLRQIGSVDGYRSVSYDLNNDIRHLAQSQKISPKLGAETRVEFRLKPATPVMGQVVDAQGVPIPFARFACIERKSQSSYTTRNGTTDDQGKFEIRHLFAENSFDPLKNNPANQDQPHMETIFFWSPQQEANATVQIPWPPENQSAITLKVTLQPAAEITGRLVDEETGEGVPGVKISPRYSKIMGLTFSSSTSDEQGDFVLPKMFSNTPIRLTPFGEYIGSRPDTFRDEITLHLSERLDLGEIPLIVYRDLEELLELPDLKGLSNQQALEALMTGLIKLRQRISEIQRKQSGRSYWQSIQKAEQMGAERFGDALLRLGRNSRDADFEFKVLTSFLAQVNQSWAQSFQADRAKKVLIEKYIDREEMEEWLPRMITPLDSVTWHQIFDRTTNTKLKAIAGKHVFSSSLMFFQSPISWQSLTDQQFDSQLNYTKRIWKMALEEPQQEPPAGNLRSFAIRSLRDLLNRLETAAVPDRIRLEQVVKAIKELLPEES